MEKLATFNVSDLYESQEKLTKDLQNLMSLLDISSETTKDAVQEPETKTNSNDDALSYLLSSDEENYLERLLEHKIKGIIQAIKFNNHLRNLLYRLVKAIQTLDSELDQSSNHHNYSPKPISIQTQTPPRSPVLTEQAVQAELEDMNEVIVLETINNDHPDPLKIIDSGANGLNDQDLDSNTPSEASLDHLRQIKKMRKKFKRIVKEQQKREKNLPSYSPEGQEADQQKEFLLPPPEDPNLSNDNKETTIPVSVSEPPLSHLSEALKNHPKNVPNEPEDSLPLEGGEKRTNDNPINPLSDPNHGSAEDQTIHNNHDNPPENKEIPNENPKTRSIAVATTASAPRPIHTKNRKNYKRKNKNSRLNPDLGSPSSSNEFIKSKGVATSNPLPLSPPVASPSQGIYLGKSNVQQTVLSTKIQSIFSKPNTNPTTRDAECQTESYKVVIRGEDYPIPPGYLGHYAVVPLWTIWVIGYYYKKKTKPKSMWKLLASKMPGLLAKSRAQQNITRVERIS